MRRLVPCSLIASLLLVPLVTGAAGLSVFSDVPEYAWYATYVKQAAEAGIVSGYKDTQGNLTGKFGPSDPVTIAQALKIAVEGAGYDVPSIGCKVYKCHWAYRYIRVAQDHNFTLFLDDLPQIFLDRPATRAEVAQIIVDTFNLDKWTADLEDLKDYIDVDSNHPYAKAIEQLTLNDVMMGDGRSIVMVGNNVRKVQCIAPAPDSLGECPKTTFRPDDNINRAETVKIVMSAKEEFGEPGSRLQTPQLSEGSKNLIIYTNEGFTTIELHVKKGSKVLFKNESDEQMWIASDPHPNHTNLEYFDAGRGYKKGEIYEFDFLKEGSWGFHNHMNPPGRNPQYHGVIIVE